MRQGWTHVEPETPMDRLVGFLLTAASRRPELLEYDPVEATDAELRRSAEDRDYVVVDSVEEARFAVLLSEALRMMGNDIHAAGDRTSETFSRETVRVLVKEHGTIRAAARAVGCSHNTLRRALRDAAREMSYAAD